MKIFSLSQAQIARVIGAAAADELSRRFNRHVDFLTIASWTQNTALGRGGMLLDDEEKAACARRAASLFGLVAGAVLGMLVALALYRAVLTFSTGLVFGLAGAAGAQSFDFGLYTGQWDNLTFSSSGPVTTQGDSCRCSAAW